MNLPSARRDAKHERSSRAGRWKNHYFLNFYDDSGAHARSPAWRCASPSSRPTAASTWRNRLGSSASCIRHRPYAALDAPHEQRHQRRDADRDPDQLRHAQGRGRPRALVQHRPETAVPTEIAMWLTVDCIDWKRARSSGFGTFETSVLYARLRNASANMKPLKITGTQRTGSGRATRTHDWREHHQASPATTGAGRSDRRGGPRGASTRG